METTELRIVENKKNLKVGTVLGIVFISFILIFLIIEQPDKTQSKFYSQKKKQ